MKALSAFVAFAACVLLGGVPPSAAHARPGAPAAAPTVELRSRETAGQPNIIFILVDDFSTNLASPARLADSMPNLAQMEKDGVTFSNYFVTDSLCCPSRSSIFTGKFPHNHHVLMNTPPLGGYIVFNKNENEAHTFALALQAAGYRTALMGKYLNGYEPTLDPPARGWNDWAVAGRRGYQEYNYSLNHNRRVITPSGVYLTDELATLGQTFIQNSASEPFFLELATFAPHGPFVPPRRDRNNFPGLVYDKSPPFGARADASAPWWLRRIPPLLGKEIGAISDDYRKRVQSDQATDEMIGEVRALLVKEGLDKNTYVIFSSDNGLHMGEYSLRPGKETPFDIDIRVPLVILGPGVPAGVTITQTVENIDLAPTFMAMAGAQPGPVEPDGMNLVPLIQAYAPGGTLPPWRDLALIEHQRPLSDPRDPDEQSWLAGDPPSYGAIRTPTALYVRYTSPDSLSYYDLVSDPLELHNIGASLSLEQARRIRKVFRDNMTCVGTPACFAAQQETLP